MRLIDADKAKAELLRIGEGIHAYDEYFNGIRIGYKRAAHSLVTIPTVEERKHGYWKGKPLAGYCTVRCSYCRVSFEGNSGRWKYCPECGAKMDGVNDGCF